MSFLTAHSANGYDFTKDFEGANKEYAEKTAAMHKKYDEKNEKLTDVFNELLKEIKNLDTLSHIQNQLANLENRVQNSQDNKNELSKMSNEIKQKNEDTKIRIIGLNNNLNALAKAVTAVKQMPDPPYDPKALIAYGKRGSEYFSKKNQKS